MKQLLVLEGSPRRGGNSAALAGAFCAALKGWQVERAAVCTMKIRGCAACEQCWTREGKPCVQRDDMNDLCLKIEAADAVVFATPMYYFGFPAQLKAAIDRLYPYCKGNCPRSIRGKRCFLLTCGATSEREEFDALLENYRILARYVGREDMGILAADSLYEKGAAEGTPWLAQAAALADRLAGGAS